MYGSLSADLMRALGRYGVKNFLTIGTAGSLTRKLPVGTIFTPEKFDNGNNQFEPIKVISPIAGVPVVGNYEKVDSPNIETKDWLSESTAKGLETVEVELGHLILWAKQNPEIKLVLVQMGTRSKIDHLGIVSIEKDGAYLYEFTNSTGIQKIFISEFWKRSADRLGKVHYVVGEFHNPLSKDEWQLVKEKLDHWALHLDSNPPKNCLETLIQSLATMRAISVKTVNVSHFIELTFKGKIEKIIKRLYPDYTTFPVLSSIFDTLIRVDGNLPSSLIYPTETSFLNDWTLSGDLSKFTRTLSGNLSEIEIKKESDELIKNFEAEIRKYKNSCTHFYIFNPSLVK